MKDYALYKLINIIVVLIFSIVIFVPFIIGIIEKDKAISVTERRKLSTCPKVSFNLNSIQKFPELFDKYYSDHVGLRERFVKYYKLVKLILGDSPSDDVTIGRDGWLFLGSFKKGYKNYSDPIGDVRNLNLFSKEDLKKFAEYIVSLKAWLNDKDVEYIFVIAPNKHTVYFDKLPYYISKENSYSATDQLVEYLKYHTTVQVVDLRKQLIEQKNRYQLYGKTDTHWNHYGANIAQYEIMLEIKKLFPDQIDPEIMKIKEGIGGGGDLAFFIGLNGFNEPDPKPIFDNGCIPVKYPASAKGRETHSFSCDGQKLNVVIYRDSFFAALEPYFSRKFKKSTYIWEKLTYNSLEKYVELEGPDIVIEEWVERSLPRVPNIAPELKTTSLIRDS